MGPKLKKPPKNSFSFFLDDYVEEQRKNGRNISHKIAAEECGPAWKALPEHEKQKYGNLASIYKEKSKNDKTNKYTCFGISYAQLEQQQEELRLKTERADAEIKLTISNLDSELIKTHLFYIVHCNYYCKTDEGVYVPGEIAIVEFNLGEGIRNTYHTLINPGKIPLGYAFEAKQTIDEIHGLPDPPYEEGEDDYCGILNSILKFLEPGKMPDGRYPPLYCIENNIKASENVLQTLSTSRSDGKNFFRVFLLHKMFFSLKNKCVEHIDEENVGFPVISIVESEINRDTFRHSPGISCAFHMGSEDKYFNCSLSMVQRYVFLICDHCCQHIDVPLVPGKHTRFNADVDLSSNRGRIEESRRKPRNRISPPPSEAEYDGKSSYADDISCFEYKSNACSFLHDEIESKFSGLEVSSVTSRSSRHISTPAYSAFSRSTRNPRTVEEDSDSDSGSESKYISVGRGSSRRYVPQ